VRSLESALAKLDAQLKQHAADLLQVRTEVREAGQVKPSYWQNNDTATVHLIRPYDSCRTVCGYEFKGPTYRTKKAYKASCHRYFDSLQDIPGTIMCERCLPAERSAALARDITGAEVSADEHEV